MMDKYRKVERPKESSPPEEIRVTGSGFVRSYVTYATKLFNDQKYNNITIRATGKAVSIAVSVAEIVKRRIRGLHQLTTVGMTKLTNEYEPLEEGLDRIEETRSVSFISIQLVKDQDANNLDKNAPGYQPPLDQSLVKEVDQQNLQRFRARGRNNRWNRGQPMRQSGNFLRGRGGRVPYADVKRSGRPGGNVAALYNGDNTSMAMMAQRKGRFAPQYRPQYPDYGHEYDMQRGGRSGYPRRRSQFRAARGAPRGHMRGNFYSARENMVDHSEHPHQQGSY